jgi:hypothetical protein
MSAEAITIDVMADGAAYLKELRITPPTKFWAKAVASALKGLRVPLDSAVTFRRQGSIVKTSQLGFLLRGDA